MSEIDEISPDFLRENRKAIEIRDENLAKLSQIRPQNRRGPWNAIQRVNRVNEVARLHSDYGFSARKISELLKIPRNTINSDLDVFYNAAFKNLSIVDPTEQIFRILMRLDVQRTRLREQLDKTQSLQDKLAIENLILSIDSKSIAIYQRVLDSERRVFSQSTERLNEYLEKEGFKTRYVTVFDTIKVSKKTRDTISSMIKKDKEDKYN